MTIFFGFAVLSLVLDRAAKVAVQQLAALGDRIVLIRGLVEVRYTHNTGMALGFLSGHLFAGILLPLLAMALGAYVLWKFKPARFVMLGAGLVFGGFLGNFMDRILFGYVVDMIYFPWMPFFICNGADIAITFGAVLLGFSLLFRPGDWQEKEARHDG